MRYLLDTNLIIEAVGGSQKAVEALEVAVDSEWVGYSAITRLELFGYPKLSVEEEEALTAVIEELAEVAVSSRTIDEAIRIRKHNQIKVPDAIIAATAIEHKASLVTRNEVDFKHIINLTVYNPWK